MAANPLEAIGRWRPGVGILPGNSRYAADGGNGGRRQGRSEDNKLRSLDDDADLLGEEPGTDKLFQLQMGAANLFLGYWKVLLYIAGGVLLVAAAYGGWDSTTPVRSRQVTKVSPVLSARSTTSSQR